MTKPVSETTGRQDGGGGAYTRSYCANPTILTSAAIGPTLTSAAGVTFRPAIVPDKNSPSGFRQTLVPVGVGDGNAAQTIPADLADALRAWLGRESQTNSIRLRQVAEGYLRDRKGVVSYGV